MRLVIFGPPGAGKGTQAQLLRERYKLKHISTGQLFRAAMKADTPLGRSVQSYVSEGRLVPDEVVWDMTRDALEEIEADQFILDGYPRTVNQAELFEQFLKKENKPLSALISLEVSPEVIVERLSRRRVDPETGNTYHLDFNPPPAEVAKEDLIQREDDQPASIRQRIQVYDKETAPVKAFYEERNLLYRIDGEGTIEEVQTGIVEALSAVESSR